MVISGQNDYFAACPLYPRKRTLRQRSLPQALDALEADHAFLLRGDVFTKDVIETWLSYKRESEVDAIALRPHPYEFHLYFDV